MNMLANMLLDKSGHIREWNDSAHSLFGFPRASVLGRHSSFIFGGEAVVASLLRTAAQDGHADYCADCVRADGSAFPGRTFATALREGPDLRGYCLVVENLAARVLELGSLRELYADALGAREVERARVASGLRGYVGDRLTAVMMDLGRLEAGLAGGDGGAAQRIAITRRLLREAIAAARRLATELRPAELDNLGLNKALLLATRELSGRTGVAVWLDADPGANALRDPTATSVYRLLLAALDHLARATGTTAVHVALSLDGAALVVRARGGRGGAGTATPESDGPRWFPGIQERVRILGGSAEFRWLEDGSAALDIVIPAAHQPELVPQ